MRTIKRVDGRLVEVDDTYILANGESYLVPLSMMDSRRMVTDSRGVPSGSRPGFLFADHTSELDAAHQQYRNDIEQRWRSARWSGPPAKQRAQTDATSVEDAYAQYARDLSNRWQRG